MDLENLDTQTMMKAIVQFILASSRMETGKVWEDLNGNPEQFLMENISMMPEMVLVRKTPNAKRRYL
jgi:hypothetical protein